MSKFGLFKKAQRQAEVSGGRTTQITQASFTGSGSDGVASDTESGVGILVTGLDSTVKASDNATGW